jgi:hypothetical protein
MLNFQRRYRHLTGLVRLGRRFWRTHHLRRPAAEAPEFPNALVIDLPEATLLPGLINMHTHPSYSWEEPDSGTYTYFPEKIKVYMPITVALKASNYLYPTPYSRDNEFIMIAKIPKTKEENP